MARSHVKAGDPGHRPVILCVDDHQVGLQARSLLLQSEGYAVISATSAGEALAAFTAAEVDAVITDYYLPDQVGTELAAAMKSLRPWVPILLVSGSIEQPPDMGGADQFLCKAIDPLAFLSVVRELIGRSKLAGCAVAR
jgi:CheY-like chemotaxis protein